jgi:hypothetical protein
MNSFGQTGYNNIQQQSEEIMEQEKKDITVGEKLIAVLGLKVKSNGRVDTAWGDKTPLGLALTVKRILEEA